MSPANCGLLTAAPIPLSGIEFTNSCYLTVTSLAFRSWNRGLALTTSGVPGSNNPFAVWTFNGTDWVPNPSFPGSSVCGGNTILWAGKLDYWVIGSIHPPSSANWPGLCRFDGSNYVWEPFPLPAATLAHVPTQTNASGVTTLDPGEITSGACYAWNDCWFFGSYGVIVHWDGTSLSDATPTDVTPTSPQSSYTSASAHVDATGAGIGVAATAAASASTPQILSSTGGAFAALTSFSLLPGDTFATDLDAVDVDTAGQGWTAGNPAGLTGQATNGGVTPRGFPNDQSASGESAPLAPFSTSGASACQGPPANRFEYLYSIHSLDNPLSPAGNGEGAFAWSSISVDPTTGDALAGGQTRPPTEGTGLNQDDQGEPVLVSADCDGTTVATTFRVSDPTYIAAGSAPLVPADRDGTVTAVASNADNDAWAATSVGGLQVPLTGQPNVPAPNQVYGEAPHLYRLTNGLAPDAPAGDDNDQPGRLVDVQPDAPIVVIVPPPPPPPPSQVTVREPPKKTKTLAPAVYDVKVRLQGTSLYLTFKLRRATTIGAEGIRDGRVVSASGLKHFTGKSGVLVLVLSRSDWPTSLRFVTDLPHAKLEDPGARLSGAVKLNATVSAYTGRHIVSVLFQYSPAGKSTWSSIATVKAAPWSTVFDTTTVPNGLYDLRVVATDSAHQAAASAVVQKRKISNAATGASGASGAT